jgi:hypothetical protein
LNNWDVLYDNGLTNQLKDRVPDLDPAALKRLEFKMYYKNYAFWSLEC